MTTAGDWKVTFEQSQEEMREGTMWVSGGSAFQAENSLCKGPEAGMSLLCPRSLEERGA